MAENITWADREDATTPTGAATEADKTIYNTMKSHLNEPVQKLTAFTDADIIIDGTKRYSTTKVITGSTHTITANAILSNHKENNYILARYQFDVDCDLELINFDATGSTLGTINPIPAGTYNLWFYSTSFGVALVIQNNTGTTPGTLATPTIVLSAGNGQLGYVITGIDPNATAGILEYSIDNVNWTTVVSYSFGTETGTITGLTNGVLYYSQYRNSATGYNPSEYATDTETPASVTIDYAALSNVTAIIDDVGLVAGEDNSYGNVSGAGVVNSWKTVSGEAGVPTSEVFTLTGTGVTLDSSGVQFDGNGWLEDLISTPYWNNLHLGPNLAWTVTIVAKCGNTANPDAVLTLLRNNGGTTSNNGIQLRYDDRSGSGHSDGVGALCGSDNGAGTSLLNGTIEDAITANELGVLTFKFNHDIGTNGFEFLFNGVSQGYLDGLLIPKTTGDAFGPMALGGGLATQEFIGTIRTVIVQTGVYTTETSVLISQLKAKYGIN